MRVGSASDQSTGRCLGLFNHPTSRAFGVDRILGPYGLDNAVAESFFKTLKSEMFYRDRFTTHEQARRAVFDWIEAFYNPTRLHSTLGYLSPDEFERLAHVA